MKHTRLLILFVCTFIFANTFAANRYWVGGTAANWSATTSWSETSGGANGASIPAVGDDVIFDNSSGNANPTVYLGGTITVNSITFTSSNVIFSGSFNQSCTNSVSTTSFNITLSAVNPNIKVGQTVTLAGTNAGTLASSTTVSAISGTTLTLNKKPTANSTGTGTLTFAVSTIITTNMTLDNSQVAFADVVTINSALTFSGTTTVPIFSHSSAAGSAITLGNGGAFTLTGNSGTNYFTGGGNSSFRYNTTSALTVFFKPGITISGIYVNKGLITVGNDLSLPRLNLPALGNPTIQELIVAPNVTLTLSGSASSGFAADGLGGTINASASGSKVLITSTSATVLATTGRIFKPNTTINNLEVNTTGNLVLGFPITVRTLTKTAGTITTTSTNTITIAAGGSVVAGAATISGPDVITGTSSTRYWVGGTAGNWFNAANWGTSSGNTDTDRIPEYGDNVVFDNSTNNENPTVTLTDHVTAADINFTNSNVNFAGAYSTTTNSMTLNSSQVKFVDHSYVNSSLTFSGTDPRITQQAASSGRAFVLGNGGAFTLTGNSASNYFTGNTLAYYTYNTTSPLTVYFNPTTTTAGALVVKKGLITLGNSVSTNRITLNDANSQELIVGTGATLGLVGGGTSSYTNAANGGVINASAADSKVLITSTAPTLLGVQSPGSAIAGRIFKDGSTINHLEYNSASVFYLPYAMTVKNLTLTAGAINNSTNNITIPSDGNLVVGTGTTTAALSASLASAPPIVTATAGDGQASIAFTVPANGGSLIADYTVTPYDGVTAGTPVTLNANPIKVTNLNNGTFYTFKVKANNGLGSGTETTSSAVKPDDILNDIPVSTIKSASELALTPVSDVVVDKDGLLTINQLSNINSLTVAAGGKVTNTSTLTTPVLTLNSNATDGTATYLDNGTSNITTLNANQYLGTTRNWYVSSPVVSTASSTSNIAAYYEYIEAGDNTGFATQAANSTLFWKGYTPGATFMAAGKGYIALPNASSAAISFSGTMNSGEVSIPLSKSGTGFNLIGNPYPCHLTWTEAFATANASKIYPTIWVRTNSGSSNSGGWSFTTYNALVGEIVPSWADVVIAPMQAFWVKAKVAGPLTLDNTLVRSHNTSNRLKAPAAKNTDRQRVRLQVSNGTTTDEALLYFDAEASNTYDDYDSPKYEEPSTVTQIYTSVGTEKLVINGMNAIVLDTPIQVGFVAGNASSFTIKANELSNLPTGVKVILKDNATQAETDLTDGTATYNFSPTTAPAERFSLIFRSAGVSTDIENTVKPNAQVFVNAANQITIIALEKSTYTIYNVLGQKVNEGITTTNLTIANGINNSGAYVVRVSENGRNYSTRVILNGK